MFIFFHSAVFRKTSLKITAFPGVENVLFLCLFSETSLNFIFILEKKMLLVFCDYCVGIMQEQKVIM